MELYDVTQIDGLNRKTSPFLTKIGQLSECQNIDLSKIGVAAKNGDYELKNARISASQNILGLGMFVRAAGTYEHYAVCDGASNSEIYKDVNGTWTSQSQTLTAGATGRFASVPQLDTLFFVNYSDATRSYNGSAWSTATNVTSAPKARYLNPFHSRLFLGNVVVGATAYPARYYFSSSGSGGSITWSANDYDVLPNPIKGFGMVGENQLIFTEFEVFRADEYESHLLANVGTSSQETVCSTNTGWCLFANRDGVFATNGGEVQKVSQAVDEYFQGITQSALGNMNAVCLGDHYYLYVGDVSLDGDTLTKVVLDYDIAQNKWSRFSLGEVAKFFSKFIDSNGNEKAYFGNDDGEVWKWLSGTGQNSAVYNSFIETPFYYPNKICTYSQIEVWGKNLSGLTAHYKLSSTDDWHPIDGEFSEDYGLLIFNSELSEKIKFKFSEMGKDLKFEIHRFRFGYEPAMTDKE